MFEKILRFYELGLYGREQVAQCVRKGVLTPEQYRLITGEAWQA